MGKVQQVFNQARQGDKTAEQKCLEYLRVRFVQFAKYKIGGSEAEDLAQEACLTVLQRYKEDGPRDHFEAWAYKILRNKIGNYIQADNVRRRTMVDCDRLPEGTNAVAPASDPMLRSKMLNCLKKVLKGYPRYARVLNFSQQGYRTEEICERMGVTANNLYVMLNRGRKLFNDCLGEDAVGG